MTFIIYHIPLLPLTLSLSLFPLLVDNTSNLCENDFPLDPPPLLLNERTRVNEKREYQGLNNNGCADSARPLILLFN